MKSRRRPKKKTTGDREWLYEEVLKFICSGDELDQRSGRRARPKSDRELFELFCPMYGTRGCKRESWNLKNRTTKRQMLQSTLRRLIADGKIKLHEEESINHRSMHGGDLRNIEHRRRLFGKEYDGKARSYIETNALQAIADALGALGA